MCEGVDAASLFEAILCERADENEIFVKIFHC